MAHLVADSVGGHLRAMFPATVDFHPLSYDEYLQRVYPKGDRWLMHNWGSDSLSLACMNRALVMSAYRRLIEIVTPELFNVVDGEGAWRIPYFPAEGQGKYLTEAIAMVMYKLDEIGDMGGRWQCIGVGVNRNEGDIIMKGPLTQAEISEIGHGRFPRTLQPYGIPGPGVCGGSSQVLMVESTSTSVRPPVALAPSARQRPPRLSGPSRPPRPSDLSITEYQPRGNAQRPQQPHKYIASASFSSSSSSSSGSSSTSSSESSSSDEEVIPQPRRRRAPKGKPKNATKPKRHRYEEEDEDEDEDEAFSDDEGPPRGHRLPPKAPARNAGRRVGRSDDDDEEEGGVDLDVHQGRRRLPPKAPARNAGRRVGRSDDDDEEEGGVDLDVHQGRRRPPAVARGPGRRAPTASATKGFAAAHDDNNRDRPGPATRHVGRADEGDAAHRPGGAPGFGGKGGREGAFRVSGRGDARRGRGEEGGDGGDEDVPVVDPAEVARLEKLKAENGYGKGKGRG